MTAAVAGIKSSLGNNSIPDEYPDVWTAIEALEEEVSVLKSSFANSTQTTTALKGQFKDIEELLQTYGKRWTSLGQNWIPLVSEHSTSIQNLSSLYQELKTNLGSTDPILELGQSTTRSENMTTPIKQMEVLMKDFEILRNNIDFLQSQFDELKDEISKHEDNQNPSSVESNLWNHSSLPGALGVSYKQYYFRDEEAVKSWMKDNMSLPSHGLYVDIVSFSEFFGGDRYVERNTTLNDLYMTNKIGYATMSDSIVAASFQNVLPGAYGRNSSSSTTSTSVSSDLQAQPELPGLKTFQKWDNQDGLTGRKYWIKKEARSTHTQIDGMIRQQLSGDAQYLARDLLMDSMAMSEELFNFISTSYEDTLHSGRFDSYQAWALTSKFVKRIFSEIGDVRVIARDGVHVNDPWTTAAKFLFATLKAHTVMKDFMRLDIKDHPSISSEMVKFICYSQPSHDTAEVLTRLSAAETLMRTNQGNLAKVDSRLKKLETYRVENDKIVKKLKDHANL